MSWSSEVLTESPMPLTTWPQFSCNINFQGSHSWELKSSSYTSLTSWTSMFMCRRTEVKKKMAVPSNLAELLVLRHETIWNAVGRLQVLNASGYNWHLLICLQAATCQYRRFVSKALKNGDRISQCCTVYHLHYMYEHLFSPSFSVSSYWILEWPENSRDDFHVKAVILERPGVLRTGLSYWWVCECNENGNERKDERKRRPQNGHGRLQDFRVSC